MQIFVKMLTGKTITLQVEASDLVTNVKAKIEEKEGIPICHQTLVNGNKILEEGKKSLFSYGVSNESTLQMLLRWNCSNSEGTTNTINKENYGKYEDPDNVEEDIENNNDKNDACENFQNKLVKSMTFEMNREVEIRTKDFRKLEEQRIEIDMKLTDMNTKRDRSMMEYEAREEQHIKYRADLWKDHDEDQREKRLMDKKIKEMQNDSIQLELKIKENAKKRENAAEQRFIDTQQTYDENNKLVGEIVSLKRKRIHIENAKNDLIKKKKVNEDLVEFITNTIEEKKKDLACPVCFGTAETPIYMCSLAHIICKNCLPRLKICPECRKQYPKISVRHRFAEKLDEEIGKLSMERKALLDGV